MFRGTFIIMAALMVAGMSLRPVYAQHNTKMSKSHLSKRTVFHGKITEDNYFPDGWLPMTNDELRDAVVVAMVTDASTSRRILKILSDREIPSFVLASHGIGISVRRKDQPEPPALFSLAHYT